MKPTGTAPLLILFLLLCLINLYAEWSYNSNLIFLSKPLLLTSLAIYFYRSSLASSSTFRNFLLLGFLFSIAGDSFLMFVENEPKSPSFFLYGLGSFFITHLCYLYAFLKWPSNSKGWLQQNPLWLVLFLLFLLGNCLFLWPDIPTVLRLPVVFYSTAIVTMAAACTNLAGKMPKSAFQLLLTGVLLFVLSDSLIALNKFKVIQKF